MSNGRAKWYNDLALVRERLDGRGAALLKLQDLFYQLGLQKVVTELELSVKVLGECANSVNNSIQEVSNTLNEMGYKLQEAKKGETLPIYAFDMGTGTIKEVPGADKIPEGWVRIQRVLGHEADEFPKWVQLGERLKAARQLEADAFNARLKPLHRKRTRKQRKK